MQKNSFFLFLLIISCCYSSLEIYDYSSTWISGCNLQYYPGDTTGGHFNNATISARYSHSLLQSKIDNFIVLFGGYCYNSNKVGGACNDIYLSTDLGNSFVFISGSDSIHSKGVYPDKYTEYVSEIGSRYGAANWLLSYNETEIVLLYSGYNDDDNGYFYNDLFYASVAEIKKAVDLKNDKIFKWIGGCNDDTFNEGSYSSYSEKGFPKARKDAVTFIDTQNRACLFGGQAQNNIMQDIFCYEINSSQFIWISGCKQTTLGSYPSSYSESGIIPSRTGSLGWFSNSDNVLFIFGGSSDDGINTYNDLWKTSDLGITWYWMNGCNKPKDLGQYNGLWLSGLPASRYAGGSAFLNDTQVIITGGSYSSSFSFQDIWVYDIPSNEFLLVRGSQDFFVQSNYSNYGEAGVIGCRSHFSIVKNNSSFILMFGNPAFSDVWNLHVQQITPAGPPQLYGSEPDYSSITFLFDASPNDCIYSCYRVYYAKEGDEYTPLRECPSEEASVFKIYNLNSSTTYSFKMKEECVNTHANSEFSKNKTVATLIHPADTPSGLIITSITHESAILFWGINHFWDCDFSSWAIVLNDSYYTDCTPEKYSNHYCSFIGLNSSTLYSTYVQALCKNSEANSLPAFLNFTTINGNPSHNVAGYYKIAFFALLSLNLLLGLIFIIVFVRNYYSENDKYSHYASNEVTAPLIRTPLFSAVNTKTSYSRQQ